MVEITEAAVKAAQAALGDDGTAIRAGAMREALQEALRALGELMPVERHEWAVPCLDKDHCRKIFHTREGADEQAAKEGPNAVIETRAVSRWLLTE